VVTDAASWGFGSGFLDLEEIDEADFGIFGNVLDVGEGVKEAGKDHGKKNKKKKTKKRKRGGDDEGFNADSALVVENEQVDGEKAEKKVEDGEKGEKKGKRKRNRKKRKVKDNETSRESDEDVASDNAEGDYTH
jgi:ATP-dependent RNA helicase DDX24/MAK5